MIIITHDGRFHADDVFAAAILREQFGEATIIHRSRDPSAIAAADIAIDVGGEHAPERGRFDHHQRGGAGVRASGTPFASAGLVWRAFGAQVVHGRGMDPEHVDAIVELVDQRLIAPVDAIDNGIGDRADSPISSVIAGLNPSWPHETAKDFDAAFNTAVDVAAAALRAAIDAAYASIKVSAIIGSEAKRQGNALVLDLALPAMEYASADPSIAFVIQPDRGGKGWVCLTVSTEPGGFTPRKPLPAAWAGRSGAELVAVSGIADAVFCHNGRFIGVAGSKAGAMAMVAAANEAS